MRTCQSPYLRKNYTFGECLGKGSYAIVTETRLKSTDSRVAMKEIRLGKGNAEKVVTAFLAEVAICKRLGYHPGLSQLHVAFQDNSSCFLGLDLCNGGDLRFHLSRGEPFTQEQASYIIMSVGTALNYMHRMGVMHRDVKPENIILRSNGTPVLTDFGISCMSLTNSIPFSKKSSGSLAYLAPEVLTTTHSHSCQADFWSLGIVAYELLFGKRPFEKHCWKSMIYFSENNYTPLWEEVQSLLAEGDGPQEIDWVKLATCSEEYRRRTMRFPCHDIPLLEDGSLSKVLRVPLPHLTCAGEVVTPAFADMLDGLLDVRIPTRLGVGKTWEAFSEHTCFGDKEQVPFLPDTAVVRTYLKNKYSKENHPSFTDYGEDNQWEVLCALSPATLENLRAVDYVSDAFAHNNMEEFDNDTATATRSVQ